MQGFGLHFWDFPDGSITAGKPNQAQIEYLKWFSIVFEPRNPDNSIKNWDYCVCVCVWPCGSQFFIDVSWRERAQQGSMYVPKWHPIPYIMHYFWLEPYAPGSKVVHYKGNVMPFGTHLKLRSPAPCSQLINTQRGLGWCQ